MNIGNRCFLKIISLIVMIVIDSDNDSDSDSESDDSDSDSDKKGIQTTSISCFCCFHGL